MSILNEDKYSSSQYCDECFGQVEVGAPLCSYCRNTVFYDSIYEVGQGRISSAYYFFAIAIVISIITGILALNYGFGSMAFLLPALLVFIMLVKGTAYLVYGRHIVKTDRLESSERDFYFKIELAAMAVGFILFSVGVYLIYKR